MNIHPIRPAGSRFRIDTGEKVIFRPISKIIAKSNAGKNTEGAACCQDTRIAKRVDWRAYWNPVLIITVAVVVVLGCESPLREYKTLVVDKDVFRFSSEYPTYLRTTEPIFKEGPGMGERKEFIIHLDYIDVPRQPEQTGLTISADWPLSKVPMTPKRSLEWMLRMHSDYPDFKLIDRSSRTVSGLAVEEATFHGHTGLGQGGSDRVFMRRSAVFNGSDAQYWIWWLYPLDQAEYFRAEFFKTDFDHILETFKLLK